MDARRPTLVIGAGANRKRTCAMLRQFVKLTGIPAAATQMGKGVIDERDDAFVATAALSSGDFVHRAIDQADLIINVGHDPVEKPPFVMGDKDRLVIHVDFSPAPIDPVYRPHLELVGDIANALSQLSHAVEPQADWDFRFAHAARTATLRDTERLAARDSVPLHTARVVAEVRSAMPEDGLITLDNGLYKLWFARGYPTYRQNTVLLDNAFASMGAGLPSAIAAALVDPKRATLAVCGDGGFMMNSQEMKTAVRLGIDLTVLVLRDDAYGMIRWKQAALSLPNFGLSYGNPDLVAYARSYGAHGHRVTAAGELGTLITSCRMTGGVHLIDCPIDYSNDAQLLGPDLAARAAALKEPIS